MQQTNDSSEPREPAPPGMPGTTTVATAMATTMATDAVGHATTTVATPMATEQQRADAEPAVRGQAEVDGQAEVVAGADDGCASQPNADDQLVVVRLLVAVGERSINDRLLITRRDAARLAADGVVEALDGDG